MAVFVSAPKRPLVRKTIHTADIVSCCCTVLLLVVLFLSCARNIRLAYDNAIEQEVFSYIMDHRACDEIYLVEEGETLSAIIEKCGDPFIVEKNPHVHDSDDVFPGILIRITPMVQLKKF